MSWKLLFLAGYSQHSLNEFYKPGKPTITTSFIAETHGIAPNLQILNEKCTKTPEFIIISQPSTIDRATIHAESNLNKPYDVRTFDALGSDISIEYKELYQRVYEALFNMGELKDSFFDKMQEFLLLALAKMDYENGTALTSLAIAIREILKRVFPSIVKHIE